MEGVARGSLSDGNGQGVNGREGQESGNGRKIRRGHKELSFILMHVESKLRRKRRTIKYRGGVMFE